MGVIMENYFHQYGLLAMFVVVATAVPIGMLVVSYLASMVSIRPHKPNQTKSTIYECGVEPIGPNKWIQFDFKYYMYALLFVIFDIETIFLFPWAIQFNKLGMFALIEMFIFVMILLVGLIYAWKVKALEWGK
tara:strand:+ start:416 stop:814 length:399 start_codon:yes stop_codon:yes gene_type:complete